MMNRSDAGRHGRLTDRVTQGGNDGIYNFDANEQGHVRRKIPNESTTSVRRCRCEETVRARRAFLSASTCRKSSH
eukprot:970851-Pyramimonas_sp.AAC.2